MTVYHLYIKESRFGGTKRVATDFASYDDALQYWNSNYPDSQYMIKPVKIRIPSNGNNRRGVERVHFTRDPDTGQVVSTSRQFEKRDYSKYGKSLGRGVDKATKGIGGGAKKVHKAIVKSGGPNKSYTIRGGTFYPRKRSKKPYKRSNYNTQRVVLPDGQVATVIRSSYRRKSRRSNYSRYPQKKKKKTNSFDSEKERGFEEFFNPLG